MTDTSRPNGDPRGTDRDPARSSLLASATTGGSAGSSTRSIRAASPTRMATGSATCPGSSTTSTTSVRRGSASTPSGCRRSTRRPGLDLGYDVSDHERVDPLFGTEDDFDRLVDAAHRRGIRVILDLVMNHTSDAHRWFVASRAGRDGPYADWYLWRDPAGEDEHGSPLPPNNWVSFFGGPGWEWEPARRQFYYHTFLVEQPELDWRAAGVEDAQFEMVRGWLARGVDGFRLDVFNTFLKHPDLPSNPSKPGVSAWDRQVHLFDRDQPDFPALIGRFRAILDEEPGRMSIGELFDGTIETAAGLTTDRHLVFDWQLLVSPWDAPAIRAAIEAREGRVRHRPLADDRAVEPRSVSPRLAAAPRRSTAATAMPSPVPRRSCCSPCAGRRSCTTARRSVSAMSTSGPRRASTRRRSGSARTSAGGTGRAAGARCPGPAEPAPGSRPVSHGCGWATTSRRATSRGSRPTPSRSWRATVG